VTFDDNALRVVTAVECQLSCMTINRTLCAIALVAASTFSLVGCDEKTDAKPAAASDKPADEAAAKDAKDAKDAKGDTKAAKTDDAKPADKEAKADDAKADDAKKADAK
jgi:uncharacterized lipoprotein NlpE involved in copper resistance